MDYYCTEHAQNFMSDLSPEDISECIEYYESPTGCILITDNYDNTYLTTPSDFQADSRLIQYNESFMSVEYFENGIPTWLNPLPGLRIYLAEWAGSSWKFTKVQGI